MPVVEYVTIGYARNMQELDVITVLEVGGSEVGIDAITKFGPRYSHHFDDGTVLSEEMADPDVPDDDEFAWSGSGRQYIMVTTELVEWAGPFSDRLKELAAYH